MDTSVTDGAAGIRGRAANVLHLMPPDAARLARIALPMITAADAGAGLRVLLLTEDDAAAVAVAHAATREVGGGAVPIVALTSPARARRALTSQVPVAAAIPLTVAAALIRTSSLQLSDVRHVIVAMPRVPGNAAVREALDAIMAELPKPASRTLVAARETADVEAIVERHFFKARRMREEALPAPTTYTGYIKVLAVSPGTRWDAVRRLLDEIDPSAAVVLASDSAELADARHALSALGYPENGAVIASRDTIEYGTAMVILMGVPEAGALRVALAAAPAHLIVLCSPNELGDVRAMAGPIAVRAVVLDGPQARAASRESATRARLREILVSGEFARELSAIAPLLDEFDGMEVAAAALVLAGEATRTAPQPAAPPAPPPRPAQPSGPPSREPRGDSRGGPRGDSRGAPRGDSRGAPRGDSRSGPRGDSRGAPRGDSRSGPRGDSRGGPRGERGADTRRPPGAFRKPGDSPRPRKPERGDDRPKR